MSSESLTRRLARLLGWLGLLLAAAGLGIPTLTAAASVPAMALIGAGVVALGLGVLLGGDLILGPPLRLFSARGEAVRGEVVARAGLCDVTLSGGLEGRLASVRFGPFGKPFFRAESGMATLRLSSGLRPNIASWEVVLARNVLWDVHLHSTLGDLTLDLSELRLERITACTALGRLCVRAPLRGYVQMHLRSALGVVEVDIPPRVGAQVTLRTGALAATTLHNGRLREVAPHCYRTEDYETAASQIDLQIDCAAGEVHIT